MSLSLLLEKYDVSTDEGLQKALNEIEKEESEVDEALSGVLTRACSLEGRLRSASQAYTKLAEVKSDAQTASEMVDKTAALARDVSAKVRQLDLARSRVAECQHRVHDLIDLQVCTAGVEAAIKAHDYETGAAHVSRFLSMSPESVAAARARGACDPRADMTRAADTLRAHLVNKLEEAARRERESSVERLFRLFPQIGRAEEGVDLLARYLAKQAEANIRRACVIPEVTSEAAVFADAITRVVEAGGAAVERARCAARCAPGHLPRAIRLIQPAVCAGVRRVYVALVGARRLEARAASPLALEPVLAELALAISRLRLYFNFLARKTEVSVHRDYQYTLYLSVYVALVGARRLEARAASPLALEPVLAELALAISRLRLYFNFLARKTEVSVHRDYQYTLYLSVYVALVGARRLEARAASPLALEPVLAELALAISRLRLYFNFLARKTEVSVHRDYQYTLYLSVYVALVGARRLEARAASPLALEPVLAELALAISRLRLYFNFLARKTEVSVHRDYQYTLYLSVYVALVGARRLEARAASPLALEPVLAELALAISRLRLYFNFLARKTEVSVHRDCQYTLYLSVYVALVGARRLEARAASPLALEPVLAELALAISRLRLYFNFLARKTEVSVHRDYQYTLYLSVYVALVGARRLEARAASPLALEPVLAELALAISRLRLYFNFLARKTEVSVHRDYQYTLYLSVYVALVGARRLEARAASPLALEPVLAELALAISRLRLYFNFLARKTEVSVHRDYQYTLYLSVYVALVGARRLEARAASPLALEPVLAELALAISRLRLYFNFLARKTEVSVHRDCQYTLYLSVYVALVGARRLEARAASPLALEPVLAELALAISRLRLYFNFLARKTEVSVHRDCQYTLYLSVYVALVGARRLEARAASPLALEPVLAELALAISRLRLYFNFLARKTEVSVHRDYQYTLYLSVYVALVGARRLEARAASPLALEPVLAELALAISRLRLYFNFLARKTEVSVHRDCQYTLYLSVYVALVGARRLEARAASPLALEPVLAELALAISRLRLYFNFLARKTEVSVHRDYQYTLYLSVYVALVGARRLEARAASPLALEPVLAELALAISRLRLYFNFLARKTEVSVHRDYQYTLYLSVYVALVGARRLEARAASPLALEPVLAELALAISRLRLYFNFLARKTEVSVHRDYQYTLYLSVYVALVGARRLEARAASPLALEPVLAELALAISRLRLYFNFLARKTEVSVHRDYQYTLYLSVYVALVGARRLEARAASPLALEPVLAELALAISRLRLYFNFLARKTEVSVHRDYQYTLYLSVYVALVGARRLEARAASPLALEPVLAELALAISRLRLYFNFLARKTEVSVHRDYQYTLYLSVYVALVGARRLEARAASPLALEPVLAELALAISRLRLYFNFLARKTEADAAPLEEAARAAARDAVDRIIAESDLMRTEQDLLGHYLALERYYLEESVNKALKMATPTAGATSSSLVDDVFYIARKVIRRSLSTGSIEGACAVLNEVSALLERGVAGALRRLLRSPPPDPLPLAPPGAARPTVRDAAHELASRLSRDADASRALFLAHMNEAESGAEWSERLASEACAEAEPLYRSDTERAKLTSCAAGLAAAAAAFRAARDTARAALLAALRPRVAAWADALAAPTADLDEMEDDADALPLALEQFVESGRGLVSQATLDAVLHTLLQDVCARAEQRILHYHYTRESGLAAERRARRLAAWAGAEAGAARDKAARLAQAAALLALDAPEHARHALRPHARLPANTARDILARRSDFKIEDIKRLKL